MPHLQAQIDEIKRTRELAAWGVDLQKYRKFPSLTPQVLMARSGLMEVISAST